ncbi:MAG TPA: TlpA disulfide reductase family protein [Actinomycetes bacterium]|nr:TlpA disulfide reductase family protein [Actinomycetes bacterium]
MTASRCPGDTRRPSPAGLVLLVAALVAGLAGCGWSSGGAGRGGAEQAFVAGNGSVQTVPAADRKPAPALAGTTLTGDRFDLGALRGKVVVLNVWASWCAPCRAEAPNLEQVYQSIRADGVAFVGLNTRDEPDNARAFERRVGISYPSVVDRDGELLVAFRGTLPPAAIPTTLVIDREGRMAARALTPLSEPMLRDLLAPIVAERGRA